MPDPVFAGWDINDLDALFLALDLVNVPKEERKKRIERLRLLVWAGHATLNVAAQVQVRMEGGDGGA